MIKYVIYILFLLALLSCSNVEEQIITKLPPFKPEVKIIKCDNELYVYTILTASNTSKKGKVEFIKSIRKLKVHFMLGKRIIKKVVLKDFLLKKITEDSTIITCYAGAEKFKWENAKTRTREVKVKLLLYTSNAIYALTQNYSKLFNQIHVSCNRTLYLIPFNIKTGATKYVFGTVAIRRKIVDGEYLPSSEDFRAEIFNFKGKALWSSNYRKNYMTMIQKVQPLAVDSAYLYTITWNGRQNGKRKIDARDYQLRLTIPAKPKPYIIMQEFQANLEW